MIIYYLLIVIWFIIFACYRENTIYFASADRYQIEADNNRLKTVIGCALILLLVMGLRAYTVGTDTKSYMLTYMSMRYVNFSEIRWSFDSEVGYKIIQWLLCRIGVPWQLFLFIISSFIVFSYSKFLYKYCVNIFLGFYLYMTIGLFSMNMTGLRQSLSVAILLFAIDEIHEKKIIKTILLILVASTIHYSAFICLPVFLIFLWKFSNKRQLLIGLILPILTRIFSSIISNLIYKFSLAKYTFSGYFDSTSQMNILVEVVAIVILLGCYVCLIQGDKNISDRDFHFFILTGVYVACIELSGIVYMALRLGYYFMMFMTVSIVNDIYRLENRNLRYFAIAAILIFPLLQFLISTPGSSYGIDTYSFFWNI